MPRSRPPLDPAPAFFVDRSLGYQILPSALRERGFVVHTMRSVYGAGAEETVTDEEWLEKAGREGWVVLHQPHPPAGAAAGALDLRRL